jgi:hypothetical protein
MDNQTKSLFGAWIQATGTVIAAIGSTQSINVSEHLHEDLNLWGNVLQAAGNALQADAEEKLPLVRIGNEIQAIGNSAVTAGIVINFEQDTEQRLINTGNWLQALGGATALGVLLEESPSLSLSFNIVGNLLQVIGNSLQAISGKIELAGKEQSEKYPEGLNESQTLDVIGSWLQAVGSVLTLLAEIRESAENGPKTENTTSYALSIRRP